MLEKFNPALIGSRERVAAGREADLPVFYGDAGSVHVLERVGLHRAKAVVVLLDTPAAMYRYGRPN